MVAQTEQQAMARLTGLATVVASTVMTHHREDSSAEKCDEILATPKGSRPDPSEYLSQGYIHNHLEKFADGATRFMPESNLEKYGLPNETAPHS